MKGQIYLHEYNYPEAIKLFDKAIEVDPSYEDSYINKIYCLYLQKNYKECIELPQRCNHFPKFRRHSLVYRGLLQHNDGTGKAIEYLKKAHELNPKDVGILTSIAWEYYSLEDYAKASEYAEKAAEISADDESVKYIREKLENQNFPKQSK